MHHLQLPLPVPILLPVAFMHRWRKPSRNPEHWGTASSVRLSSCTCTPNISGTKNSTLLNLFLIYRSFLVERLGSFICDITSCANRESLTSFPIGMPFLLLSYCSSLYFEHNIEKEWGERTSLSHSPLQWDSSFSPFRVLDVGFSYPLVLLRYVPYSPTL